MRYTVVLTVNASFDEEEAYFYYEQIKPGLGENFLDELLHLYACLARNPHSFSYIDSKNILKDAIIKRFPYVVIFEIIADKVIIFSIHNTHRQQTKF